MNRELVTDPLGLEDLWEDLRENIRLLKSSGYAKAMVFFGFGWGEHIYDGKWKDIPMSLDDSGEKNKGRRRQRFRQPWK